MTPFSLGLTSFSGNEGISAGKLAIIPVVQHAFKFVYVYVCMHVDAAPQVHMCKIYCIVS